MRVLVTGVAGQVGARLAEFLLEGGHRVLGLDLMDEEEPDALQMARLEKARADKHFEFVQADLLDAGCLDDFCGTFKPEAVVHLATRRDLDWAEHKPQASLRLHAEGAAAVMEACNRHRVGQLILRSSHHVYGGSRHYPLVESDAADRPLSMTGAALRSAELAVHALALASPVSVTVARIFCVYGPGQARSGLVPILMDAAERRISLPVNGDGTASRDMVYVDDVVLGLIRMLDRPAPWRILNLGSGLSTTLAQVAEQVAWLSDVHFKMKTGPIRLGDLPHCWADLAAAHGAVGYKPVVTLEEGLRRTWEWFMKRPETFR